MKLALRNLTAPALLGITLAFSINTQAADKIDPTSPDGFVQVNR